MTRQQVRMHRRAARRTEQRPVAAFLQALASQTPARTLPSPATILLRALGRPRRRAVARVLLPIRLFEAFALGLILILACGALFVFGGSYVEFFSALLTPNPAPPEPGGAVSVVVFAALAALIVGALASVIADR